jgi:hypothetical protein
MQCTTWRSRSKCWRLLKPDDTVLVIDSALPESIEERLAHAGAPLFYGFSLGICMSSGLSEEGGAGLGPMGMPASVLKAMAEAAGSRGSGDGRRGHLRRLLRDSSVTPRLGPLRASTPTMPSTCAPCEPATVPTARGSRRRTTRSTTGGRDRAGSTRVETSLPGAISNRSRSTEVHGRKGVAVV